MVKSIARKRKRQFYGNKFTNTSKKNSISAVPECTACCSKLGNESFSTAEEMPGPVLGNKIVDLELIVEAFAQLCCPKCFAEKVELFENSRYGLCSLFTLKFSNREYEMEVNTNLGDVFGGEAVTELEQLMIFCLVEFSLKDELKSGMPSNVLDEVLCCIIRTDRTLTSTKRGFKIETPQTTTLD
ncbi:hypothetical protein TNCV_4743061 [Trichonephila clavipes]|nr:hypothetical protein TNCV_4743061 [Trichonephila clavipes]